MVDCLFRIAYRFTWLQIFKDAIGCSLCLLFYVDDTVYTTLLLVARAGTDKTQLFQDEICHRLMSLLSYTRNAVYGTTGTTGTLALASREPRESTYR